MSEKKLEKVKLNCLTDFQRAGVLYLTGNDYQPFFAHGKFLLKEIGDRRLLLECKIIEKMIKKRALKKYVADRMLTVGVLASC